MADTQRPFAIWLSPAPSDYKRVHGLIAAICRAEGAPVFEPHLTVYAGMCTQTDVVRDSLVAAARDVPALALKIKGIGYAADFFKSLFIQLESDPALETLHAALKQSLGGLYLLQPHVSLLYKDLAPDVQRRLAAAHPVGPPDVLRFDSIKLVTTDDPGGWRAVTAWRTCHTESLGSSPT